MKKIINLFVWSILTFSLLTSASAIGETKDDINEVIVSRISLSQEDADLFYKESLSRIVSTFDIENTEYENGGIVAYSNGLVKQTIFVTQRSSGTIFSSVVDHWYRLMDINSPVCDVVLRCAFDYNGTVATPLRDMYGFSYTLYAPFNQYDTFVKEKSVSFRNGVLGNTSARVDTYYSVEFMGIIDNETISMECDRNGNLTKYGQNESI